MATLFKALTKKASSTYADIKNSTNDFAADLSAIAGKASNRAVDDLNNAAVHYDVPKRIAGPKFNALSDLIARSNLEHRDLPGGYTMYNLPEKFKDLGEIGAFAGLHNMPGTGAVTPAIPAAMLGAAAAPIVGSIAGATGDSGFVRGGLRGLGATAGGVAGLGLGTRLADYLAKNETVRNMNQNAQAAVTLASLLGGTLGGGYLGYRGAKALSKSDKEKEKEEREKQASASHFGGNDVAYIQKLIDYINAR